MANRAVYNDPTANDFPHDYDQVDVDKRTALRTDAVRHKKYGVDVREAIAQGIEINSVVSGEAKSVADNAEKSAANIEERFNTQIASSEKNSEVVDARHSSVTGNDYSVLGDRLNNIDEFQPLGIVNFTFDDSYSENVLTKSIFEEYGLICDFAIITDKVNNATNGYQGIDWYIDAYKQGYGIQSHTRTHRDLNVDGLSDTEVYREIVSSKKILENLGLPVSGFVSPSSVTKDAYSHLIEENYDYAINHLANNYLSSPMDRSVDRYHLQRMSLAATDIDLIKKAIDKTIANRMLLMFYDHRTGYDGSASEAKLREVLEYVKEKTNQNKLKVLKSIDAIADFFKVTPNQSVPLEKKGEELALPLGRYLINQTRDYSVWNVTAPSNPSFTTYNANDGYMTINFDGTQSVRKAYITQFVDVSKHVGEAQPHFLSISFFGNASDDIPNNVVVNAYAKFLDKDGNKLGDYKEKPIYVNGDRIVHNNVFGYPSNAYTVELGFTFYTTKPVNGKISVLQPSILEDQTGYTGECVNIQEEMQVGFTPDITKPKTWSFSALPSFTVGIARRYFDYDESKNFLTCLLSGTYNMRLLAAYKISNVGDSTNPRILVEVRVNDTNANNANSLRRVQSTRAVGDIYNIDSSLKIALKAGDQVRFATDADMAGTPTMEVIANSFVVIRREV